MLDSANIFALISSLFIVAIAELGDKTQLLVMSFATKYKLRDVLIGVFFAILALNIMAVGLGSAITKIIPISFVKILAGISFLCFSAMSLKQSCEDAEKDTNKKRFVWPVIIIFFTFFIGELGDKTQLTAIALSAGAGGSELFVLIGCVLGMMISDCAGLFIGKLLGDRLKKEHTSFLSFIVFLVFGIVTLFSPLVALFGSIPTYLFLLLILVVFVFSYRNLRKKIIRR